MKKIKNVILNLFRAYVNEFRLVIHDQGIMLFFLFLPLAYPIIYSLIYNPELVKDVDMVVIDSDRTPLSRKLTRMIDACDEAHVIGYAADLPEARKAMNSHQAYAILEIPEGFSKKIGRGETGNAVLYSDMSLLLRYRGFLVATTNVMAEIGGELMTSTLNEKAPMAETLMTQDLLPIHNVSMGDIRNGFDSFIMPGVLILILQQCIVLACGMAGGAKREHPELLGFNPNDRNAPATLTVMIGQTACFVTIIALPMVFLIHYVPLIFRFPMQGDLLQEIAYLTPMVLASCGVGFAFQAVVKEREEVFVSWVFTSLIFLFLSGLIWPRYDMPEFWRCLSAVCPATWGVEGFIKMNANGTSLAQLADNYRNLWLLTAGWWIVGWMAQKWVIRRQLRKAFPQNMH